jgi:hypothetical protein
VVVDVDATLVTAHSEKKRLGPHSSGVSTALEN